MTSSLADRLIPGFGGQIFTPGTVEYDEKRVQYAFSSYPEKQAGPRRKPSVSLSGTLPWRNGVPGGTLAA
jgi:hypothetical protein